MKLIKHPILILLFSTFSLCSGLFAPPLYAEEQKAGSVKEILKVGVIVQYPFVTIDKDDGLTGLFIDKMTQIAQMAGYDVEFHLMPSTKRFMSALHSGQVDVSLSGKFTANSKRFIYVKYPFLKHSLVVITDDRFYPKGVKTADDLTNGKIGYVKGYYIGQNLTKRMKNMPPEKAVQMLKSGVALKLMKKGRISSFIIDSVMPDNSAYKRYQCDNLNVTLSTIDYLDSHIMVHKGPKGLDMESRLNQALIDYNKQQLDKIIVPRFWKNYRENLCDGYAVE